METTRIGLPMIAPGQLQKELFHNEALQRLDMLVAAAVEEPSREVPPSSPDLGACYIAGANPTGEWSGFAHHLCAWTAGGWRFVAPVEGMEAYVRSSGTSASFRNSAWEFGDLRCDRLMVDGQQVISARQPAIAEPSGGSVIDAEARVALGLILARLQAHGLIA